MIKQFADGTLTKFKNKRVTVFKYKDSWCLEFKTLTKYDSTKVSNDTRKVFHRCGCTIITTRIFLSKEAVVALQWNINDLVNRCLI